MVTILLWSTVAHADLNRDNAVNDPDFFATGNQPPQNRSCHRAFLPARTASVVSESEQCITAINEPQRVACGAPDFIIQRGELAVGHVEARIYTLACAT